MQARFYRVRTTRRVQAHPERVAAYLQICRTLVSRAETALGELGAVAPLTGVQIEAYLAHARRQIDQAERRRLRGETIPHDEKVFSIFANHTRWSSKGKAGRPVELGVPVYVLEDQHGFLLHHEILWRGGDTDIAMPMIEAAQARYPELRACFWRALARVDREVACTASRAPRGVEGAPQGDQKRIERRVVPPHERLMRVLVQRDEYRRYQRGDQSGREQDRGSCVRVVATHGPEVSCVSDRVRSEIPEERVNSPGDVPRPLYASAMYLPVGPLQAPSPRARQLPEQISRLCVLP